MADERKENAVGLYALPRVIEGLDECYFYHTMDLPKYGLVIGEWDLRSGIEKYLGHLDFDGKRVLDVGTASGFLAFWMERHGADVVGFDLSQDYCMDQVPFGGYADQGEAAKASDRVRKVNNSFWLAHTLLGSRVRMVYGTVYNIPKEIGPFEVATVGSILIHLRDPFLALQSVLSLATEAVIISNPISILGGIPLALLGAVRPVTAFLPSAKRVAPRYGWWSLPPRTIVEFLRILGFHFTKVTYHIQRYYGKRVLAYTVVGRRTR